LRALEAAAAAMSAQTGQPTGFTRSRGDGWQMFVADPAQALRALVMMRAALRQADLGLETRIAAGIGTFTLPEETARPGTLSAATGHAFTASGQALDMMGTDELALVGTGTTSRDRALLGLIEWQTGRWTAAQAQAANLALGAPDAVHATIAKQLGITRQAVQARLAGAGLAPLEEALAAYEASAPQTEHIAQRTPL
ncbi:MAG: hypothetical protein JKX69_14655, partial [Rhodobacteraceae bacterium]|nr:hypothetical protein [Paracoccaceae bacterium]